MLKKPARIINLILWIILFLAFVFADTYKLDVLTSTALIGGFGVFHILSVIFGFLGIACAVILVLEDKPGEESITSD
ncbi:MAG: hypothetical protein HQ574_04110 [Chloroflexi bacterium]|nr:hypothetical protein [Chloroflexota bacterium]